MAADTAFKSRCWPTLRRLECLSTSLGQGVTWKCKLYRRILFSRQASFFLFATLLIFVITLWDSHWTQLCHQPICILHLWFGPGPALPLRRVPLPCIAWTWSLGFGLRQQLQWTWVEFASYASLIDSLCLLLLCQSDASSGKMGSVWNLPLSPSFAASSSLLSKQVLFFLFGHPLIEQLAGSICLHTLLSLLLVTQLLCHFLS